MFLLKESLEPNEAGLLQDLLWTPTGSFLVPIADQAGCFCFAFYLLNSETEYNYPFYSDLPLGGLQIDLHSSYPLSGDHGRYLPALS
jgi:hypothetical protein